MSPEDRAAIELLRLAQEIRADLDATERLRGQLARYNDAAATAIPEEARTAAIAVALHAYFGAIESILGRIARVIEGDVPVGPDWYRELLRSMTLELPDVRPRVLSSESYDGLTRLLAFRHFFRHAYAVTLDETRLRDHSARVLAAHDRLSRELADFAASLATGIRR